MAENQIPFEATLIDDGLTVGIEGIATSLERLEELGTIISDSMSGGFTRIEEGLNNLARVTVESTDRMIASFRELGQLGTISEEAVAGINALVRGVEQLNTTTSSIDASLMDAVNVLDDIRTAAESTAEMLAALSEQMAQLSSSISEMGGAAERGSGELAALGRGAGEGDGAIHGMAGSVGDFVVAMAGFTIINDAIRGLDEFGNAAIYGNATVERMQATLEAMTGSKGAAQAIVDWSYKFGRSIPDTTTNLQKAIVTIASLGINVQDFMPSLATMAGVMGETLPIAAQAFLDAFSSDRFFMLQRRLRVTKEELQQYGLVLDAHGKMVQSTLVPAFEALVKARFPQGLSEIMGTFTGQVSNLIDQMQQLGMAFGKPIFDVFEHAMFGIINYLNTNHQAIWDFAQSIGAVLGGAIAHVTPLIGDLVQFLEHNHAAFLALGAVILGIVGGAFFVLISSLYGLISGFLGIIAIAGLVGLAVGGIVGVIVHFVETNYLLRDALKSLYDAIRDVVVAVGERLYGAFLNLAGPVKNLSDFIQNLFGHFVTVEQPVKTFSSTLENVNGHMVRVRQSTEEWVQKLEYVRGPLSGVTDFIKGLSGHIKHLAEAIHTGNFKGLQDALGGAASVFGLLAPIVLALVGAFQFFGLNSRNIGAIMTGVRNVVQQVLPIFDSLFAKFLLLIDGIQPFLVYFDKLFAGFLAFLDGSEGTVGFFLRLSLVVAQVSQNFSLFLAAIAPVVAVVAAIALIVGSVVFAFVHWWQTSEGFRKMIVQMGANLLSLGKTLMDSLKPAWEQIQASLVQLKPTWDQLVETFHQLEPLFLLIGGIIIGILVVAFGILFAVVKAIFTALGPLISGIVMIITGLIQVVVGVISFVVNLVMGLFAIIKDIFTGDGKNLAKDWDTLWHNLVSSLQQIVMGLWNILKGLWTGIVGTVIGFVTGLVSGIIDWFTTLFDKLVGHSVITDGVKDIIAKFTLLVVQVIEWINKLVQFVLGAFIHWRDEALATIHELVFGTIDKLQGMALEAINQIGLMVVRIIITIEVWRVRIVALVQALVAEFIAHLEQWITQGVQKAQNFISSLAGVISSLPAKMAQWATDAVNGFIGEFGKLAGKALDVAKNTASNIASLLHHSKPDEGPLADDDEWMPDFVNSLAKGLEDNTPKLTMKALAAAQAMSAAFELGKKGIDANAVGGGVVKPAAFGSNPSVMASPNGMTGNTQQTTINVQMPNSFASGFNMLDPAYRAQIAQELVRDISQAQARGTDLQTNKTVGGYAGYAAHS